MLIQCQCESLYLKWNAQDFQVALKVDGTLSFCIGFMIALVWKLLTSFMSLLLIALFFDW